jgi:hypothetical protein
LILLGWAGRRNAADQLSEIPIHGEPAGRTDQEVPYCLRAMATGRRFAFGLLVISWVALAVALVGARSIPSNYCNYEGPPSATVATEISLVVAGTAWFIGVLVASFRESRVLTILGVLAIAAATGAAGYEIGALAVHRAASWGCG